MTDREAWERDRAQLVDALTRALVLAGRHGVHRRAELVERLAVTVVALGW